jgi:ferric-dicitrate binding protein FerR (iron transport regulator)
MTERPTLDAALAAWATTEPAGAGDAAALARILAHAETIATQPSAPALPDARPGVRPGVRPGPGWMLGGALAASVAIALLLAPARGPAPGAADADAGTANGSPVMLAEADSDTRAAFALLYTPTIEEEYQL